MERIHFVTHRDIRILRADYSGLRTLRELEPVAASVSEAMQREVEGGLLVLIDMSGVPYSLRIFRRMSEMAAANAPRVRARAIVGLCEEMRSLVPLLAEFSGRPVEAFDDVPAALDWLVEQGS